jgi:hypothetical protein
MILIAISIFLPLKVLGVLPSGYVTLTSKLSSFKNDWLCIKPPPAKVVGNIVEETIWFLQSYYLSADQNVRRNESLFWKQKREDLLKTDDKHQV